MYWLLILGVLAALIAGYWLLVSTEGVFLGRRVVIWLYDLTAFRYDRIKQYDEADERVLVTYPVLAAVEGVPMPRLLDVATGTGRVPFDLMQTTQFTGQIVGIDASSEMLERAADKLAPYGQQVRLIRGSADALPFPDNWFDGVICLEALEFFPSAEAALREVLRVLQPGRQLLVTRRSGREGRMFLHRYQTETELLALLRDLGAPTARAFLWEEGYDLVIAQKAPAPDSSASTISVKSSGCAGT